MRVVTGHQPVYLPWLGLFHKIGLADVYVFMDDVQYVQQDWINRNRIKGAGGAHWLTVPIEGGAARPVIRDTRIVTDGWGTRRHWQNAHWLAVRSAYARAPHWSDHAGFLEEVYCRRPWCWLSELNAVMLRYFLDLLNIEVKWVTASQARFDGRKSDLVLDHCRRFEADLCVLGCHGRDYIEEGSFREAGVSLYYQDYSHPAYAQRFGEFVSHLSVLDLLCNCGPESRAILTSGNVCRAALEAAAVPEATVLEPLMRTEEP